MRFRIPVWYDTVMDGLAAVLFPSRRFVRVTLAIYFLAIAGGVIWWTDNWLWGLAVILCAAMAYIMDRMMFGEG